MATNLFIAYPDIPFRAVQTASNCTGWDNSATSIRPYRNCLSGERWQFAGGTDSATTCNIEFDLGSGVTSAVDYLIVARATGLTAAAATTVKLATSTALAGTYSDVWTGTDLATTLYGPYSNDYIKTGLALSAARSWRVEFSTLTASAYKYFSKIYFGTSLDLGGDLDYFYERIPPKDSDFYFQSGARAMTRLSNLIYRFKFTWRGVTDAKAKIWSDNLERYRPRHRFFLFTTGNHHILDGQRIIHARLTTSNVEKADRVPNRNTISAEFEEVLG